MTVSGSWRAWLLLWLAAITLDASTTGYALASGLGQEANPVAASVMEAAGTKEAILGLSAWALVFTAVSLLKPTHLYTATIVYSCRVIGVAKLAFAVSNLILLVSGVDTLSWVWNYWPGH